MDDRTRPAEREDCPAGSWPPFCPTQAQAMRRVMSPVAGKPQAWPRSAVYGGLSARACIAPSPAAAQRHGPLGAMSDETLTTAIRGCLPSARCMAKGTAKSGHDCAVRGPAPHCAGCRGGCGRTACLPRHGPVRRGGRVITMAPSSPTRSMRCGAPT